jgi:hypothetical protein
MGPFWSWRTSAQPHASSKRLVKRLVKLVRIALESLAMAAPPEPRVSEGNLMPRLRRPSPALVLALLALMVALGSSAGANPVAFVGKALNGKSIKKHSIPLSALSPAAVKQLRGARGATGPPGLQGAKGDSGATNLSVVSQTCGPSPCRAASVMCPAGTHATGGGKSAPLRVAPLPPERSIDRLGGRGRRRNSPGNRDGHRLRGLRVALAPPPSTLDATRARNCPQCAEPGLRLRFNPQPRPRGCAG